MGKAPAKRPVGRPKLNETPTADMAGKAFAAWLAKQGLTDSQASRALGTSPSTIARYKVDGAPAMVGLACAALAAGLRPWNK